MISSLAEAALSYIIGIGTDDNRDLLLPATCVVIFSLCVNYPRCFSSFPEEGASEPRSIRHMHAAHSEAQRLLSMHNDGHL